MEDLSGIGDELGRVTPDASHEALARARLRAAVAAESRRRALGPWAALAALVVVMATVGAVGLGPPGTDPAVASLLQVADTVAVIPVAPLPSARLYLTRSERLELMTLDAQTMAGLSFLQPSVREVWVAADGSATVRTTYGSPQFFTVEDRAAFEAAGLVPPHRPGATQERVYGPAEFVVDPAEWPTDAPRLQTALLDRLQPGGRVPQPLQLLMAAVALVRENGADPGLRAAVLRVIAGIPGIRVGIGGDSVTVSYDATLDGRTQRSAYEFDALTGHLVGESITLVGGGEQGGTVLTSSYQPPVMVGTDPGRT